MNDFSFLNNNRINEVYSLSPEEIEEIREIIEIPKDLLEFYSTMGYGFINSKGGSINRLLDPNSFANINLRRDFYENDPDLEIYDNYKDKKIFFEVNEGTYLLKAFK